MHVASALQPRTANPEIRGTRRFSCGAAARGAAFRRSDRLPRAATRRRGPWFGASEAGHRGAKGGGVGEEEVEAQAVGQPEQRRAAAFRADFEEVGEADPAAPRECPAPPQVPRPPDPTAVPTEDGGE
jgi:hypothetical protein